MSAISTNQQLAYHALLDKSTSLCYKLQAAVDNIQVGYLYPLKWLNGNRDRNTTKEFNETSISQNIMKDLHQSN